MPEPTDPAAIAAALAAPFRPDQLRWLPKTVKGERALAFPYVSAADVMNKLDRCCGLENWKDAYEVLASGAVVCRLSVRVAGEWVTKCDVGSPSEQPDEGDRVKAAFSDALKRAAVRFGVARYLHYLKPAWVTYDPQRKQIVAATLPELPAWARPEPTANGKQSQPQLNGV